MTCQSNSSGYDVRETSFILSSYNAKILSSVHFLRTDILFEMSSDNGGSSLVGPFEASPNNVPMKERRKMILRAGRVERYY